MKTLTVAATVAGAILAAGCGRGGPNPPAGKTHVTGRVEVVEYMAVDFVAIRDGKPDESERYGGTVVNGRYEVWLPPGRYELRGLGADARGPKLREVEVGTEPMTIDILERPKKK